jgi:hypothetical protein
VIHCPSKFGNRFIWLILYLRNYLIPKERPYNYPLGVQSIPYFSTNPLTQP